MLFFPPSADLADPMMVGASLAGMEGHAAGLLLGGPLMPIRPSAIEQEQRNQQEQQAQQHQHSLHLQHQLFMMEQHLQQQQHQQHPGFVVSAPPPPPPAAGLLPMPPMFGQPTSLVGLSMADELQKFKEGQQMHGILSLDILQSNALGGAQSQPNLLIQPLLSLHPPSAPPSSFSSTEAVHSQHLLLQPPQNTTTTRTAPSTAAAAETLSLSNLREQQQQQQQQQQGGRGGEGGNGTVEEPTQMAMPPTGPCGLCRLSILDKSFLLIDAQSWHLNCVRCVDCGENLEQLGLTCFARNGLLYCRRDYLMKFGKRCERCAAPIERGELVMRVPRCGPTEPALFHVHCFTCICCGQLLSPGEQYTAGPVEQPGGALFCRAHFHVNPNAHQPPAPHFPQFQSLNCTNNGTQEEPRFLVELNPSAGGGCCSNEQQMLHQEQQAQHQLQPSQSPSGAAANGSFLHQQHLADADKENPGGVADLDEADTPASAEEFSNGGNPNSNSGSSGQQKQKRMRTSFKHHQLRTMKNYFSLNHNPDAKDLKQLAQKTGLTKRVLQVWFQNARAKFRRNQQHKMGGVGSSLLDQPPGHLQPHQQQLMFPPMVNSATGPSAGYQPNLPLGMGMGPTIGGGGDAMELAHQQMALVQSQLHQQQLQPHQQPTPSDDGDGKTNSLSPAGGCSSTGNRSSSSVSLNAGGGCSTADDEQEQGSEENSFQ